MTLFKYTIGYLLIVIGALFVIYLHPADKVPATPVSDFLAHSVLITLGVILIILTYIKYLSTLIALFGVFALQAGLITLVDLFESKKIFEDFPKYAVVYIVWFGFGILVLFYSQQTHNKRKNRDEKNIKIPLN